MRRWDASARQAPLDAARAAALLQFGRLIGNTDMHAGNLSFMSEHGRSCALAPALFAALGRLGEASETVVRVAREGREFDYALYAVLRPEATP